MGIPISLAVFLAKVRSGILLTTPPPKRIMVGEWSSIARRNLRMRCLKTACWKLAEKSRINCLVNSGFSLSRKYLAWVLRPEKEKSRSRLVVMGSRSG